MKYFIYSLIVLAVVFIGSQIWAQSQTQNIEMYPYKVLKEFDGFEIRQYEKANFAYVTMDEKTYEDGSSKGFGQLAGYIFGGNAEGKKIAMTSPVEMVMEEGMTMKFMVPAQYKIEDLPRPDDIKVKFKEEPEKVMAAIRFGGFANDEKIIRYKEKLIDLLEKNQITYNGQWSFLGYNPPFELVNRRNEVVLEINNFEN